MKVCPTFAAAGFCLVVCTGAQADTLVYDSNTIPLTVTTWANTLNIPKFDPLLGTLLSVQVDLLGNMLGNARAESLDSRPATLTLQLGATITLRRPDLTPLVVTTPAVSRVQGVGAFDGVIDWGGVSGVSFLNQVADDQDSFSSVAAADLALFTGVGNLSAPVNAVGNSFVSGSANLASFFDTQAGAVARVTYTFSAAAVPEPGRAVLMLAGLGVVGLLAQRRLKRR